LPLRRRAIWTGLGLAAVVAVIGFWALNALESRRLRQELAEARREIAVGQYNSALQRLKEVGARRPGWDEVRYQVGVCEQGRGRPEAALAAWAEVPQWSRFAGLAAVQRARADLARGRLGDAEDELEAVVSRLGTHAAEARRLLLLLLRSQDRPREMGRLLRAAIEATEAPQEIADLLGELWNVDHDPYPIDAARSYLDDLARDAPDDDRVWLGRANLATRSGRLDEADKWLTACERRRDEDPAVWRARLDWAIAANRPDVAWNCLPHVYVENNNDPESKAEAHSLSAWSAAQRGDRNAERMALKECVALTSGDLAALERLAELAVTSGRADEAAGLRRRKDELDRARLAYVELLKADKPLVHAAELARLAETLGMAFEARWWSWIAGKQSSRPSMLSRRPLVALAELLPNEPVPAIGPTTAERGGAASHVRFDDDAASSGLDFIFQNGRSAQRQLPETMSGGVGLLDYDGDGWLDAYVVQGGAFPPDPSAPSSGDRLFRNKGDGTFEDVTTRAGLADARGYGHGVAVGDFDNDGRPDVFVTRWRSYALYRNNGYGTFEDVTAQSGLAGDHDWPTSAAFADLDGDGDLDLYVCHYLDWDAEKPRVCADPKTGAVYYCAPAEFAPLTDHVFRNDRGRFTEITAEAGFAEHTGRGLGVVAADLDDDGKIDIYVANDMSANFLFRNLGSCRFEEVGHASGVATGGSGGNLAGMGIACGDLDGDGKVDLVVTNFFGESSSFYHNLGAGQFSDHAAAVGLAALTRDLLGFGVALFDADNDGRLDLLSANGHVNDGRPQFPWKMPAQLLMGTRSGRLGDAAANEPVGAALRVPHLGRGLAAGDLDNDGRIDAVIVSQGEALVYLHNRTERTGSHFVTLLLEGTRSNKDAIGALVKVRAGEVERVAQRVGGGSYQSSGDPRLHFGLGPTDRIDWVEVRWPSGAVERFEHMPVDTGHLLREGSGTAARLPGWKR
jgi:tetratricopeptide (TPR) repeat protein